MKTELKSKFLKFLLGIALAGGFLYLYLGLGQGWNGLLKARAQEAVTPTPDPHFTVNTLTLADGTVVDQDIINGPPAPPPGFAHERQTVPLPAPDQAAGINTLTVPAYRWVFGCSAVTGAMIAAYYDRNDFPYIYAGPTDGGVMPMDDSSWPTWSDGYDTYPSLPLAASRNGVDGRTTRGSIDDYWVRYESSASDPYITGSWAQHAWEEAIGDTMKTSQSAYGNPDGATTFYTYTSSAAPLTCSSMETLTDGGQYISSVDGTYGRKLFYEARGYTVTDCYNQKTDNTIAGGFSFAQYKAEIDAGRPVMLNLVGHTVAGVGYDDSTNTVYLHDTWDTLVHSVIWGESYSGMQLRSVSIVNPVTSNSYTLTVKKSGMGTGTVTSNPPGIDCGATCAIPFAKNTLVTLTAGAGFESTFGGWSGAGCTGKGTCTVKMDASKTVTATFKLNTYLLSVSKSPTGGGTITSEPPGIACGLTCSYAFDYNTVVTLAAKSNPNYIFTGWSGSGCSGKGTCTVTMDAARSVSASFTLAVSRVRLPLVLRVSVPGIFNKSAPLQGTAGLPTHLTLDWADSSGAASYAYCIDMTNDNACSNWISTGTASQAFISSLNPNTKYYWQARATNLSGDTYADGGAFWSFTTSENISALTTVLSAGNKHTCALTPAGGVKCWGYNYYGQLGDGTTTSRNIPVDVVGLGSGVSAISSGNWHTCALMQNGGVKCWGYNAFSQLGDGTTTNRLTPVDVAGLGSGVSAVSLGDWHTCVLMQTGGVKCWGYNGDGQLGDGTNTSKRTPVDVAGLSNGVNAISAGWNHTCALKQTGGVMCWGENDHGQLGNGTTDNQSTPVEVAGLASGMSAISAGHSHTCALTTAGGVKCWGYNFYGQLGNGTTTSQPTPVDVVGLGSWVSALSAGDNHNCVLTLAGGLKCWGDNTAGNLGDGTPIYRPTPVNVVGLGSGVNTVSAGGRHSCALVQTGGLKCWGLNTDGQLGDGTNTSQLMPVDVIGFP